MKFQASFTLGVICWSFWWSRVSVELSTKYHISKESIFLLPTLFTTQLWHLYVIIGNMRVWMIKTVVYNDTSLLLIIISNSSIDALPNLSLISWIVPLVLYIKCHLHTQGPLGFPPCYHREAIIYCLPESFNFFL